MVVEEEFLVENKFFNNGNVFEFFGYFFDFVVVVVFGDYDFGVF